MAGFVWFGFFVPFIQALLRRAMHASRFAGLLTSPGFLVGPHANNAAAAPRAERGCLPPYGRVPTTIWVPKDPIIEAVVVGSGSCWPCVEFLVGRLGLSIWWRRLRYLSGAYRQLHTYLLQLQVPQIPS
jgi:hypothetical protein